MFFFSWENRYSKQKSIPVGHDIWIQLTENIQHKLKERRERKRNWELFSEIARKLNIKLLPFDRLIKPDFKINNNKGKK